ncbi:glycoside hydrolase family 88 protein [Photobacterium sp. ZSDE20]|uniref:Glycoside hydrolase family 88 protein n=1 Tax=Photobacterium pectinilyticum TaxID=2906793 RepID=A0ABT1N8V0_9GAMM|nr:glycoside hydrolase family 88 protein [Photobacterium sp. ZSDE20]MCQ1061163.1 glycoside hydrolase family 88 protein [Photobacterium sp. ZSDE20]MDD1829378.1 glycoside hydrolase family 88 protein [Photobacterium sp. ZSDE20]
MGINFTINFEQYQTIDKQGVTQALSDAINIIKHNLTTFTHASQMHSSVKNQYQACKNDHWTSGFWPGTIWLAYENSLDDVFKDSNLIQIQSFHQRIINKVEIDHHDLGFLYSPSCVSAWKLTKNEQGRESAILAADALIARYQSKGGFIQAWGAMNQLENYRFIIDCLMNVPLLYWASEETGDDKYRQIASVHSRTTLENIIREDGSTYHTFFMEPESGKPLRGSACQGFSDDSAWARGQAWGIYGFALAYKHEKDKEYLKAFERVAEYFFHHLPDDLVPYWDLNFNNGSNEPRDTSSASIAACGLLEMADLVDNEKAALYRSIAKKLIYSIYNSYAVKNIDQSNGLVLHGTYSKKTPFNTCDEEGVDECVSWGDYFYMEALTRLNKDWDSYWG